MELQQNKISIKFELWQKTVSEMVSKNAGCTNSKQVEADRRWSDSS